MAIAVEPDTDAVVTYAGLAIFRRVLVTGDDLPYDVVLVLGFADGRLVCEELTARRKPAGAPVTLEGLMKLPVARLIRAVGRLLAQPRVDKEVGSQGPTDEALAAVAQVYRRAYALGDTPTAAVVAALGVSRGTAERWVARARQQGFLGPTTERKAGEQRGAR